MKTTISFFLLLLSILSFGQSIQINGSITAENTKEQLASATVSIFKAVDHTLQQSTKTNAAGQYKLEVTTAEFYIKVNLAGYKPVQSTILKNTNTNQTQNFILEENFVAIDEVVVMQTNKILTLKGDKMIFDIDKAGFGTGNDALETLTKLPGVRLDKDEKVVFRGSNNVQIMIDGKPALLTGEELKQYLKTMDGANIKAVEIIANPSAKYDASGSAGIFNIVLKKSAAKGLTGNIKTSVGYAEFIKNYNGINLYNNTEKWNFKYGLSYGYTESVNHRKIDQTIVNPGNTLLLEQNNDWLPVSNSYSGNFGVGHQLTKNANLGASFNYSIYNSAEVTNGRTNEFDNSVYKRYTILKTDDDILNKTIIGNVFYNFASDSLDTKVDAQINFANYNNTSERETSNFYFTANTNDMYKNGDQIKYNNPTNYNILSAKVDVEHKVNEALNIETGAKYSYVNNDYDIDLRERNSSGIYIPNTNRSNRLIYKESIFSGYGIANYKSGKFDFQAGLRAEYIDYNATSLTSGTSNKDQYLSLFPSFSVNANMENNQYKFSYSRRIQRPRYLYLNPYYEYTDTYNVSVGNPDLTPQFTNAFELVWINKQKTSLSLFANFSTDEMYQIISYNPENKITTLYYDNIGSSKSIGLSFNSSWKVKKYWDMQLNSELSYGQAKSDLEGYKFNDSGISYYTGLNQTFNFGKNWNATWNSFYSQSGRYGNSTFKPSYDLSFSVRKDFLDKKLRLSLSAQNVLKKSQWIQETQQDNVTTNWTNRWETRKFTLAATYNFGNAKKKEVKDGDLSDEQNRL
ncbi:outer membrane beta-barrel family protein [Frigoriflavimonas asaccharolytica]|uniref:Outer membrane receptor protein involved in Fe transport n=1 Tax=Frigoriflavimonas asaccharolytica TaxID=2735899 RepID=A0A8J8G9J1_9FLAO|nr:outer membrane beta-barrel family protein [Frigoriflavimonas asaccharolytica]NRS93155.1 outer membrane receptor protein involved in Fe transport [Frigoriflavimonas asaccharolytica]